jgi:RNA polymerase sigma-70 factor, ECF subfamily
VEALRAQRPEAFDELVSSYQNAVYNLAYRLVRDREDARDVAQDVFLKAYRRIPEMEGDLHLWAWLYRVTVNTCWDHLRAASRRPVPSEDVEDLAGAVAGDDGERREIARLFSDSLATMSPRQQAALVLKDIHGLTHTDIADTLGISRASSEILLFRARHSFRRAYTALRAEEDTAHVCRYAERAAAAAVGGSLNQIQRRRIL